MIGLFVNQRGELAGIEYFVGYGLYLRRREGVYPLEHGFGQLVRVVVQEGFGHAEGIVFVAIHGYGDLADELFFGSR